MDKPLLLTEHRHEVMQVIRLVAKLRHLAKKHKLAFMMTPVQVPDKIVRGAISLHGSTTGRLYLRHHDFIEVERKEQPRTVRFEVVKARGGKPTKSQAFTVDLAKAEERIMAWVIKNCPESIPKIVEE